MSDVVVEHSQPSQHESDERARRANRERLVRETAAAAGPQSNGPRVDEFALEEAGEGSADPDQQPADQQRPRLHFTVRDDVNLLKEVLRLDYFLSKDKMGGTLPSSTGAQQASWCVEWTTLYGARALHAPSETDGILSSKHEGPASLQWCVAQFFLLSLLCSQQCGRNGRRVHRARHSS